MNSRLRISRPPIKSQTPTPKTPKTAKTVIRGWEFSAVGRWELLGSCGVGGWELNVFWQLAVGSCLEVAEWRWELKASWQLAEEFLEAAELEVAIESVLAVGRWELLGSCGVGGWELKAFWQLGVGNCLEAAEIGSSVEEFTVSASAGIWRPPDRLAEREWKVLVVGPHLHQAAVVRATRLARTGRGR